MGQGPQFQPPPPSVVWWHLRAQWPKNTTSHGTCSLAADPPPLPRPIVKSYAGAVPAALGGSPPATAGLFGKVCQLVFGMETCMRPTAFFHVIIRLFPSPPHPLPVVGAPILRVVP